jgi:hypothetical protein
LITITQTIGVVDYTIIVKTDWQATDAIQFSDFDRIESNTGVVRSYIIAISYLIPAITSVTNRTLSTVELLSSINRLESNLETIRTNSFTPVDYPGTRVWTVSDGFDNTEANRIEEDVRLLFITAKNVFDSFVVSGTVTTGYERGGLIVI